LWIDAELARLISRGTSQAEIERYVSGSLHTLRADGYEKVLAGVTSMQEVLNVTVIES
jgi:general secretion pathway protein E